jgi:AAA15 family ATPase/GTPase
LTFNLSSIDYNKNLVRFQDNSGNEFDIDALSTGEKTLLSKVLYLYFKDYNDKVILIDEPELSLHPSWQNRVLKIYENFAKLNNCQIIIATHSPHIIGSAKNESLRILRKNSEGTIEALKDLKAHGRDINSVLFDVMGEVDYRPKEFRDKIDRLHIAIDDKKFEEATKQLDELKKDYGENDAVVLEAQMLIDVLNPKE